jgi:hypothetical protein
MRNVLPEIEIISGEFIFVRSSPRLEGSSRFLLRAHDGIAEHMLLG